MPSQVAKKAVSRVPPSKSRIRTSCTNDILIETVGDSGSSGLVDDTEEVKARDGPSASVLGGLTLRFIEVGGDSDDGVVDGATKERFGGLLHFLQDHGGNFFRD